MVVYLSHHFTVLFSGFQFNPVSPVSEGDLGYNPNPSADDRVHVLVCVISANSSEMKPSVLQKMNSIREKASDLGKTRVLRSVPQNNIKLTICSPLA